MVVEAMGETRVLTDEHKQRSLLMDNPVILFNTGWMRNYRGEPDDQLVGQFGYLRSNKGRGSEACNFLAWKGKCYGYGTPNNVNLGRLGADPANEFIDDVTVIFSSRKPGGGVYVVGWYEHSRVYKEFQHLPANANRRYRKERCGYFAVTSEANAHFLPVDQRTLRVPTGKGALGQKPVWYCDTPVGRQFLKSFEKWKESNAGAKKKTKGSAPRQADTQKRIKVEKAAMRAVQKHYRDGLGYAVKDVSDACKGWDLEASRDDVQLLIEVKGLSRKDLAVELTPNEYAMMICAKHRNNYRLAVVTDALKEPSLDVFLYSAEDGCMVCENRAGTLEIKERTGARLVEA